MGLVKTADRQRWKKGIAVRFHIDFRIQQVQGLFLKFRTFRKSFLDRIFEGCGLNGCGLFRQVGGNDLHVDYVGCQRILGDGIFQDLLVLKLDCLREDEVLSVGG